MLYMALFIITSLSNYFKTSGLLLSRSCYDFAEGDARQYSSIQVIWEYTQKEMRSRGNGWEQVLKIRKKRNLLILNPLSAKQPNNSFKVFH